MAVIYLCHTCHAGGAPRGERRRFTCAYTRIHEPSPRDAPAVPRGARTSRLSRPHFAPTHAAASVLLDARWTSTSSRCVRSDLKRRRSKALGAQSTVMSTVDSDVDGIIGAPPDVMSADAPMDDVRLSLTKGSSIASLPGGLAAAAVGAGGGEEALFLGPPSGRTRAMTARARTGRAAAC